MVGVEKEEHMTAILISKVNVYGVEESRIAASHPMAADIDDLKLSKDLFKKLFNAPPGSGHDCVAKGVTIQFNLTAPEYFWRQLDRYHFIDHVSSQSKMHKICEFDLREMCNDQVDEVVIENLEKLIVAKAPLRKIISNCPSGLRLTSRMTTNLLQLKSIYHQRRGHRLQEWQEFCDWIETIFTQLDI